MVKHIAMEHCRLIRFYPAKRNRTHLLLLAIMMVIGTCALTGCAAKYPKDRLNAPKNSSEHGHGDAGHNHGASNTDNGNTAPQTQQKPAGDGHSGHSHEASGTDNGNSASQKRSTLQSPSQTKQKSGGDGHSGHSHGASGTDNGNSASQKRSTLQSPSQTKQKSGGDGHSGHSHEASGTDNGNSASQKRSTLQSPSQTKQKSGGDGHSGHSHGEADGQQTGTEELIMDPTRTDQSGSGPMPVGDQPQYLSDQNGNVTGVFLSIEQWNAMRNGNTENYRQGNASENIPDNGYMTDTLSEKNSQGHSHGDDGSGQGQGNYPSENGGYQYDQNQYRGNQGHYDGHGHGGHPH